jgi:hypothetical protein
MAQIGEKLCQIFRRQTPNNLDSVWNAPNGTQPRAL